MVIQFAKAFFAPSKVEDKIKAAYEFSVVYDQIGYGAYSRIMEQVGNYYYKQKVMARK